MCPTSRRWCVNRRSEGSYPSLALWSSFLSYSQMFAKEVFWFNCSLLDYVIMAFEFFIRSFLSWSLGLRGTCFLAFDVFEKSGYLYRCSFALILWLLLWGAFWCAELSFVCACYMGCLCGLFLYRAQLTPPAPFFASCHESRLLLTGSFGKLVFAESCTENSVFYERHSTFAWRGWVALQGGIAAILQFPHSPFLLCLEKNLIVVVHLLKEYSSRSAVSALLWWFWLRCQRRTPPNPIVESEKLLLRCFATKQHPVSRILEKGNLLSLQEKVRPSPVNPAKKGQCGEPTYASFVTCQCRVRYT